MKNLLPILNLLGVLALAALCIVQWQTNRRLHLTLIDQQSVTQKQSAQITDLEKTLQGSIADLNDFRTRLTTSGTVLTAAQTENTQLTSERDHLKIAGSTLQDSLNQWIAAANARDAALKKSAADLQSLAQDRNDAIARYNDLVAQYNKAADEIKQAAIAIQKLTVDRNDAIQKFNDLAARYNALQTPPAPAKASGR